MLDLEDKIVCRVKRKPSVFQRVFEVVFGLLFVVSIIRCAWCFIDCCSLYTFEEPYYEWVNDNICEKLGYEHPMLHDFCGYCRPDSLKEIVR